LSTNSRNSLQLVVACFFFALSTNTFALDDYTEPLGGGVTLGQVVELLNEEGYEVLEIVKEKNPNRHIFARKNGIKFLVWLFAELREGEASVLSFAASSPSANGSIRRANQWNREFANFSRAYIDEGGSPMLSFTFVVIDTTWSNIASSLFQFISEVPQFRNHFR
jgi:hypothetical protein